MGSRSLLVFIVFISLVLSMNTVEGYEKGDVLKHIDTYSDLTFAWTEYDVCNPLQQKYLSGMSMTWFGNSDKVRDVRIEKRETYFIEHKIPVTEQQEVCDGKNQSCWYETVIVDYTTKQVPATRWIPWNGEVKATPALQLQPNCERVRIYAELNPMLGERKIDHVPKVFGWEYPEYAWWNITYLYRQEFDINTSTPQTNFQMVMNITYIDRMQEDFDDLRFLTNCSDDAVRLFAWLEDKVDNQTAEVWLNVSGVTTNTTLCMYYGNEDASSLWEGNSTFVFFDDFESYSAASALDGQGGWVGSGSNHVVTNFNASTGNNALLAPVKTSGTNYIENTNFPELDIATVGMKASFNGTIYDYTALYLINSSNSFLAGSGFQRDGGVDVLVATKQDGSLENISLSTQNYYYDFNASYWNTTVSTYWWDNDTFEGENYLSRLTPFARLRLNSGSIGSADAIMLYDDIYIANVTYPAALYSFGAQEASNATNLTGVNIYDEATGLRLNASSPDSIILRVFCTNETITIDMTGTTHNDFNLSCPLNFMRVDTVYGAVIHFRTLTGETSDDTYDFYMIDLNDREMFDISFSLYDLTGEYAGSKLTLTKVINGTTIITQNIYDAQELVHTQLMEFEYYDLELDNGDIVRDLGNILATVDGTIVIIPVVLQAIPPLVSIYTDIGYAIWGDKDNELVRGLYNDSTESTDNVTFIVYNSTGGEVYYSESTADNVLFTYSNVDTNQSYLGNFTIEHAVHGRIEQTQIIIFEVDTQHGQPEGIPAVYLMIGGLGACTMIALAFGPRHADFGAIVITLMAAFFWSRGWFNGYISAGVILFCFIIAVLNYLSKRGKGGG